MTDSDDEYDPSATTIKKVVAEPPKQTNIHSNNNNNNSNSQQKRVLGLRSGSGISSTSSTNITEMFSSSFAAETSNNNNNHHQQQQASSSTSSSSSKNSNFLIKSFISKKNTYPITDEYSYRVQKQGGAVRCVAANNGTTLLAGTTIGGSLSANASCPLFAFDFREIARGAAVSAVKKKNKSNKNNGTNNNAASSSSSSFGQSVSTEFHQEARYLFRADLFERERGGTKQQFPVTLLTFLQTSSATPNNNSSNNYISFQQHQNNNTSSSNIFAASAGGPSFKIGKVDKGGDSIGESPSGQFGSLNPESFKGHCNNILSINSAFSTSKNKPEIVTAGADGTVRLWHLDSFSSTGNVYCAKHGLSGGINRTTRVIGGAVSSSSSSSSILSSAAASSTILWSAGLDDGHVMFWDTRQKFTMGRPSLLIANDNNSKQLANVLEIPMSSTSLIAKRTLDSILVYDVRKIAATTSGATSNTAQQQTTLLPEITGLPLAAPSEAAPMTSFNDAEAQSKNIVVTFDSADESDDNFRDGVAVISLSSGKVIHKSTIFPEYHENMEEYSKNKTKPPPPPLIQGMFNIPLIGHVGLGCSDGVIRFAPVSTSAVKRSTTQQQQDPWYTNVPMMNESGARRDRED